MTKEKITEEFQKVYHKDPTNHEYFEFKKWYEAEKKVKWWQGLKKREREIK